MADTNEHTESMLLDGHTDLIRRVWAEHRRLNAALGYLTCGFHDGSTRTDGAPALCIDDAHHQGGHLIPTAYERP